jgi:predicted RNA-binding protein YlqC (UPF0109 family)
MIQLPNNHNGAESVRRLILGIAEALVNHPEDVRVTVRVELASTTLLLRVASGDLGQVIGKQGRTARSIRVLLGAASMKGQHHYDLDIEEGVQITDLNSSRPQHPR